MSNKNVCPICDIDTRDLPNSVYSSVMKQRFCTLKCFEKYKKEKDER